MPRPDVHDDLAGLARLHADGSEAEALGDGAATGGDKELLGAQLDLLPAAGAYGGDPGSVLGPPAPWPRTTPPP